jgi:hypothetical protein
MKAEYVNGTCKIYEVVFIISGAGAAIYRAVVVAWCNARL